MIDLQQYRVAIGCFVSFHASLSKSCEYVRVESKNVISVCRRSVHFTILLVLLTFLCKLLLLGGDIETNPGPPTRKCPQCSALIHIRKHSCDCGHILVKRGKKAIERRQCPQCASLVAINKPRCCCGYSFKIIDAYNKRKERTAKVRATETSKAATQRKQQNRECMANARAIEPIKVAAQRKQQHREHMANARAIEPIEVTTQRKQQHREHMANVRAIEPIEVAAQRKQQNREHMANARAIEPVEVAAQRKQQNREHMANARAIEFVEVAAQRKQQNREHMANARAIEPVDMAAQRKQQHREHMANARATEPVDVAAQRKQQHREHMANARAIEPIEVAAQRKQQHREHMANARAIEPIEVAAQRKQQHREHMANARAIETPEASQNRKSQNAVSMRAHRNRILTIDETISTFLSKIRVGPEYVCTVCHRMMYYSNVVPFKRDKYTKGSPEMLHSVFSVMYVCPDGSQWICHSCDRTLKRGTLPVQAKANGFHLDPIPPELDGLNELEIRLISLRIPFMKMVALPSGRQQSIHGPAVNVPSNVDNVCEVLPRLPSQTELIPLKLKRRLCYKGHYMYNYVRPNVVLTALRWLKSNNPLYANVIINNNWLSDSANDDNEMFVGLFNTSIDTDNTNDSTCTNDDMIDQCIEVDTTVVNNNGTLMSENDDAMDINTSYIDLVCLARQHSLAVHNVPGDGDCLFHAISYQLEHIGLPSTSGPSLRADVVSHLRANPHASDGTHYSNFISYNVSASTDTEAPTFEDVLIQALDPDSRHVFLWERYLDRLSDNAWGDDVTIRGLSDMLNVTINVFSTLGSNVVTVVPASGDSIGIVYIGLMGQRHYVGLDPVPTINDTNSVADIVSSVPPNTNSNNNNPDNNNDTLADATIEEGDEHIRQITGGAPITSVLSSDDPEVEAQICSVAPAEGNRPVDIVKDKYFEELSNPTKFPYGEGGFNTDRNRTVTLRKYFQQRLLDVDNRFSTDLEYVLAGQYRVESKQIRNDANNFIFRQRPHSQLTASQARNQTVVNESVRKDKAYCFMKNLRGSPPYYQRTFYELLAMVRQLGTPTWFLTLTAADLKWPDLIGIIARQHGVNYTDEEIDKLSFEDKSNWLRRNPVMAARHFQYRLHIFWHEFLKSPAEPLGKIVDYAIRIEFQARGSPHAHTLIWVENAPKIGIDDDQEICDFIDKYVSCSIPREEGKLKEQVLLLQQHKHSSYCNRKKNCRFRFPHPPSTCTLISSPATGDISDDNNDDTTTQSNRASQTLSKVQKLLIDGKTDVSFEELLRLAEVEPSDYAEAIALSSKGNTIVLKRDPCECNINNYNPAIMKAWGANMDIQYVLNAHACVMYVASYIMKAEKQMGHLLQSVSEEVRTEELKTQLRKVGTAFLSHREVSAQEAVYRVLSLPLKRLSRSVVFIDTHKKAERIAVLKDSSSLLDLDDDDTDVFKKSLIERYQHRPQSLRSMCLAEFAANYATDYRVNEDDDDDDHNDVLPSFDQAEPQASSKITLTDRFGKMKKRQKPAIIRFRRYNIESEPTNWYRAKLMLYYPWYVEETDLLGGYSTYEEHYNNVHSTVYANECQYTCDHVEDLQIDPDNRPEHIWDEIAPSTEESRSRSLEEGSEVLTEVAQEDLEANADILNASQPLGVRFEAAASKEEIPPDEYRQLMRGLNAKQRAIVMYNRNWCKRAVTALRNNSRIEPYRVFLSGPGGVGKSHVIRLIQSDTIKILRLSGEIDPTDVSVLLTAPTGVAAFNIGGMTLHSAFLLGSGQLGFQQLSNDKANTLRNRLSKLKLLIIDEVSMVGCNLLLLLHKRLKQIKNVPDTVMFGDVSILAVGDLYQLPPVGQAPLFSIVRDGSLASLHGSGSMWRDLFEMIELDEIMRQRGDRVFTELLCRVRVNQCTEEDICILKSRVTEPTSPDYPVDALHVYRLNKDVDERNDEMLNRLAPDDQQFKIKACDSTSGRHIDLSDISDKRSDTGNLPTLLKLAIGARVMLTVNVDVSDGLVNGARGEVVHVVTSDERNVVKILVKFDNQTVGLKAIQSSPFRTAYPNAVPLIKHEATFLLRGRRGNDIKRLQFPLTLAWATTIHKVQGLTLDEIVVDMKGGRFNAGQAYVAFSRVKTLQGLHILNFNTSAIKKSDAVEEEMARLNDKLLPPLPQLQCRSLSDSHITISLLNVRSINAKMPDILCDDNLKCASVLCFCETWLSPSHVSPLLPNGHTILRCDRQSDNNKGGVLIGVDPNIRASNTSSFNVGGSIEGIVTKLQLPNSTQLVLVLLYRSPSSTADALLNTITALLNRIALIAIPTIVMGDFNIDLLSRNHDRRLLNLMSTNGFAQLVKTPTTDRGTLIDHVYCNSSLQDILIEVDDCYYSDHDIIYCSIPL